MLRFVNSYSPSICILKNVWSEKYISRSIRNQSIQKYLSEIIYFFIYFKL